MANWRARVRVPQVVDQWVRDEASFRQIKLKDLLESIIRAGVQKISQQGTAYKFVNGEGEAAGTEVEYVIGESLREQIQSQTHLIARGKGKQQRMFLELLLIAYQDREPRA